MTWRGRPPQAACLPIFSIKEYENGNSNRSGLSKGATPDRLAA